MNKGIVMELSGKTVIVMTPEGAFEEIPREKRNCEIGEEIWYAPVRSQGRRGGRTAIYSSIAAAIVFCIVVFAGLPGLSGGQKVMAYVSLDINPSIEIGVDGKQNVLELKALNDDARALIFGLKFKGESLDSVTEMLLSRAEAGYLSKGEADIVISSTAVDGGKTLDDGVLSSHLKEVVARYVEKEHPKEAQSIVVTAFPAPKEVREAAIDQGISPGKYIVYLNAKENGVDVALDQFKQDSVHNIAKEAGGIGQLVKPEQLNEASISELLKQEKSGELDRKLKEKKAEESAKPGKSATGKPASPPNRPAASTPSKPSVKPVLTPSPEKTSSAKPTAKPKEEDKGNNGNGNGNGDGNANGNGNGNGNKQEQGKASPESSGTNKDSGKQDAGNKSGKNSGKDEEKQATPRPTADKADDGQKKNGGVIDNKKDSRTDGQDSNFD